MLENIFIFWLGLIPLVVFNNHFEVPKVFIFLIGGFLLTIYWIYRLISIRGKQKLPLKFQLERKDLVYLSWLLILFISGLITEGFARSFFGGSYRFQGVIFFLTLFIVGKTVNLLSKNKKAYLKKVFGGVVAIESIIFFFQFILKNYYPINAVGTLGEVNAISGFLAMGSYFIFSLNSKILLLLLFTIPIVFTFSRSGILAYSTFLIISLFKKIKFNYLILIVIPLVILIGFFTLQKNTSKFENRNLFWKIAIEAIIDRPILGYGAESQEKIYDTAFRKYEMPLYNFAIDRAHNLFLDITLNSGLLGLSIFIYWMFLEFKGIKELNKKAAFFAFLVYSFFQPLSVSHWILFFTILNI